MYPVNFPYRFWDIVKDRSNGFKLELFESFRIQVKGKDSSSGDSYQTNDFLF